MQPSHLHPLPPTSYYETPPAKIARLEAQLEAARHEIDRLRARLVDSEKDRKLDTPKVQSRYWTPSEHKRFLEALQKFGPKDVRAIANYVGSRNATQVRTHAQKYFLRVARETKAGNALQAARKRSMSESDLARVGRTAGGTPPDSPTARDREVDVERNGMGNDLAHDNMSMGMGQDMDLREADRDPHALARLNRDDHIMGLMRHDALDDADMAHAHAYAHAREASPQSQSDVNMADGPGAHSKSDGTPTGVSGERPPTARNGSTGGVGALAMPILELKAARSAVKSDFEGGTVVSAGGVNSNSGAGAGGGPGLGGNGIVPLRAARSMTQVSASKPPMAAPKVSDNNAGINLLSLVASEREMEAESNVPR